LVAAGLTNREIAQRLGLADRTVHSHLDHIRRKLGVSSRVQLALWVRRRGEAMTLAEATDLARHGSPKDDHYPGLTRRQCAVASLLANGLTNRQIAFRLTIATRTVETELREMKERSGLQSRTELVLWAAEIAARS
jgi:DNA-binding NarL/FixJ family response regulator